ncbi:tyrosine-type recombinase/integrase, partial [uncultured Bacteroides sp.]|uniref:tyrosine-type recombinase/integrase n=1 Tax=uncultured Bacteroides sp. TaxID=162156 RepID=UPI00259ACFBA
NYKLFYKRLIKLAASLNKTHFDDELADLFIKDNAYVKDGGYNHTRFLYHSRCIRFIESLLSSGEVDWSIYHSLPARELSSDDFVSHLHIYDDSLKNDGLKTNTINGYHRFVLYFLSYLEDKGYHQFSEIKKGDVSLFIVLVCQEHYAPTSLGAHLPGLKRFLELFPETKPFTIEIPERVRRKQDITPSYTDDELERIEDFLLENKLSARDRAIALIAFKTGLRAVDICGLQLDSIDWKHDTISINQEKTGKPLVLPLFPSLGNALMEYLLDERPQSESTYVFLSKVAPFHPLVDHSSIYNVLRKVLVEADVAPQGRISGTRMSRHSYASQLLRRGIPLTVISEALGHSNPNSTMRYISTDDKVLSTLTLPLPKGGGYNG